MPLKVDRLKKEELYLKKPLNNKIKEKLQYYEDKS